MQITENYSDALVSTSKSLMLTTIISPPPLFLFLMGHRVPYDHSSNKQEIKEVVFCNFTEIKVLQPMATSMVLIVIKGQYMFFTPFILRFLLKKRC